MNEFLYNGFMEHVRNRKFHEALSDLSEYIDKFKVNSLMPNNP